MKTNKDLQEQMVSSNRFKEISEDMIGIEEYKGSCAVIGDKLIRLGGCRLSLKNIITMLKMFRSKDYKGKP